VKLIQERKLNETKQHLTRDRSIKGKNDKELRKTKTKKEEKKKGKI